MWRMVPTEGSGGSGVFGEHPKRPLLLAMGLGWDNRSRNGGDIGAWSPAMILTSPHLKGLVFSSPFFLFHKYFPTFGVV